ncbi:unnamed protein product [Aphanomyces euteiches]
MGTSEDTSTASPPLTDFEFNMALALCDLSYEKNKTNMTYPGFKKHVLDKYDTMMKELGIDTKTYHQLPYIAYFDNKIRVIVANHGGVAFVCIMETNSLDQHAENLAFHAHPIVPRGHDDAPTMYVNNVTELGLVPLVHAMLRLKQLDKVVLCGHSRGGSVAHVVHYNLITNPNFCFDKNKEITSVAFGSTPFLRSQQPDLKHEHRFLTYVAERDVVPALFSAAVNSKIAAYVKAKHATKIGLVRYLMDFDIAFALERATEVLQGPLGEYLYYGKWTKLSQHHPPRHPGNGISCMQYSQTAIDEPLVWFQSVDYVAALDLDNVIETHSLKNAYKPHMHQAVEVPKPSVNLTLRINRHMTVPAARYLVHPDISPTLLPMLLNKAIAAAFVTKTFGDNEILHKLLEFKASLETYRRVFHERIQDKKSVDERLRDEMDGWNKLESRLKDIKPKEIQDTTPSKQEPSQPPNGSSTTPNTFNDDNITTEMNAMTIFTANMLAENPLESKRNAMGTVARIARAIALGVVGVASFGVALSAQAEAVAGYVELMSLIPAGIAVAEASALVGFVALGAGAAHLAQKGAFAAFANLFSIASGADSATANRVRSELYQESASSYQRQLDVIARAACPSYKKEMDTLALEELLETEATTDKARRNDKKLVARYIVVIRRIVELRRVCDNLVFIVLNGKQGVGKSWFIKAIKGQHGGPRVSTDLPEFGPYTPNGVADPTRSVYLIDLPAGDSLNDKLRLYLQELYGIGTIGINLFEFDVRPQLLTDEMFAMRQMYNGCDHVLVCLNKVMSKGLELKKNHAGSRAQIEGYLNTWRVFFKENNIKRPKYDIMLTDMTGTCEVRPSDDDDDSREFHDRWAQQNIDKLVSNGGSSRDQVIEWIEGKIAAILNRLGS